jgi:hypothetical protein
MKLEQIVKNQVAATHLYEITESLDEIRCAVPEHEKKLVDAKRLLNEIHIELIETTKVEWYKWIEHEEPSDK